MINASLTFTIYFKMSNTSNHTFILLVSFSSWLLPDYSHMVVTFTGKDNEEYSYLEHFSKAQFEQTELGL